MTADTTETVAEFEHDGETHQIDHLGICYPSQAGTFAIYRDGVQVAEFEPSIEWDTSSVDESTGLPCDLDMGELIEHAKKALAAQV